MAHKKSLGSGIIDIVIAVILIILSLITLYPLIYIISMSISDPKAIFAQEVWLLPKGFTLEAYRMVFENKDLWQSYYNTIWYTVVGTTISVVLTVMGAYALSRKEFIARNVIMIYIAITMFFSGGMIPTYLLVNSLGLYNTRWAMVIPSAVSAFNMIIARTYFQSSIPESLPESAKIDGCSDIGILLKIVLPLSTPIVAVMVIFYGVANWNSWFSALLYLSNSNLQPVQLYLMKILIMNSGDMTQGMENEFDRVAYAMMLKYASIVVTTLPILCVYPFAQRYFVKGVMLGAIKE